jgi:phage shock protein PspC (stress-responsive transcriptional regulator)
MQEPSEQPWPPFRFQDRPGRSDMRHHGHRHGQPPWAGQPSAEGQPSSGELPARRDGRPDWEHHVNRWRNRGDGQPLRRSSDDRLAGGVAAGIAAWRGFNPTTVRIVLAVAALISQGWAVPFYVLGWLLIPVKG